MTFDPHIIRKTYKVTVEREINVAASAKRVLATVKRHLKRRLRLRSLGEANAFVGGGERVCEEKRTHSHAEANAFELGDERVRKRRRTRLQAEANAFARGDERGYTRTQTRVRYTLHLNGTVPPDPQYAMHRSFLYTAFLYHDPGNQCVMRKGITLYSSGSSGCQLFLALSATIMPQKL